MATPHRRVRMPPPLKHKGSGSFWVAEKALDILFQQNATAWQIGAYLTLARFTDETGKFSTAAYKSIYNAIGASPGSKARPGKARELVKQLMDMGSPVGIPPATRLNRKRSCQSFPKETPTALLYLPDHWHNLTGEDIPEIPHKKFPVRFVLNVFGGEKKVWFPNELVDGYGKFKQPLLRLKQCGDVAARTLVEFYRVYDLEEFGGVPPYLNVYVKYPLTDDDDKEAVIRSNYGFNFWKASRGGLWAYDRLLQKVLCIMLPKKTGEKQRALSPFWNALQSLESNGFIYAMITVMDGAIKDGELGPDSRPIYELHPHMKVGHPPRGEEGIARRIDLIFARETQTNGGGRYLLDEQGRFKGSFPVLCRAGIKPLVVGVYRLRFRISNKRNYPVSAGWRRIERDRQRFIEDIEPVEKILGIDCHRESENDHDD